MQQIEQENTIALQKLDNLKVKILDIEKASFLKKENAARAALLAAVDLFGQIIHCQNIQTEKIASIEKSLQNLRKHGNLEGV